MQRDILIINLLFPANPMMMISSGNYHTLTTSLILRPHDEAICNNISSKCAEWPLFPVSQLRERLSLIGIAESCAMTAFVMALTPTIACYFGKDAYAIILFFGSITLLIISMLVFTRESHIANPALDVHLSDLKGPQ